MLLHIRKRYFIYFCCLFLKWSKVFSLSLSMHYQTLIAVKLLKKIFVGGKIKHLNEALLNIFRNYVPNKKKIKCDYRQSPWINDNIKSFLKQ